MTSHYDDGTPLSEFFSIDHCCDAEVAARERVRKRLVNFLFRNHPELTTIRDFLRHYPTIVSFWREPGIGVTTRDLAYQLIKHSGREWPFA